MIINFVYGVKKKGEKLKEIKRIRKFAVVF